jgi:hypothetical protein
MLGYISPDKPELKIKEYEIYSGYYCGICKSIGKRYGQIPRFSLSYDSVFLALLFSGVYLVEESVVFERCIVQPVKKRTIVNQNFSIDYAADMFLILMYFKLKDDQRDNKSLKSSIGIILGDGTFKKLKRTYPNKILEVENYLRQLTILEENKCKSIDESAEPFSKLTETIFSIEYDGNPFFNEKKDKIVKNIGYFIGKWLYLIDALDDLEDDFKNDNYNPLILKFEFNNLIESISDFRNRINERMEFNLHSYLSELIKAYDLLDIKKNRALLDNIIYFGLMEKTENILSKGRNELNGQSI